MLKQKKTKKWVTAKAGAGEEEKELPETRKDILAKIQKIYEMFFGDSIKLTEKILDNMIHGPSEVRMNLALSLALLSIFDVRASQ